MHRPIYEWCHSGPRFARAFAFGALLFQLLPDHSSAQVVQIDFEVLPDGSMPMEFSEVGDDYASLGVTFGTLELEDRKSPAYRFFFAPGGWVGDFVRASESDVGFHVLATFERPVVSVSYDTWSASETDYTVIANAMDADGFWLGSIESEPVFGPLKGRYTLEGVGPISSISWHSNQPFLAAVAIANLEFEFEPLAIDLDIRPRKDRNVIDPSRDEVVRVAIHGSDVLDVADIDTFTLVFGSSGEASALDESVRYKDVDRDGFLDLVSSYAVRDTGIAFGDLESCLSGELLDGTVFQGCDDILVIRQSSKQ